MKELNAIVTIAFRDFTKFLRDRPRILAGIMFPVVFIGVLGGSLDANLSDSAGYNFLTFVFTGVLGQTLFQSTASGVISLIEDRKNDFSQEIFVSPISRYSIIIGKILGESIVAIVQIIAVIIFGLIIGINFSFLQLLTLAPIMLVVTFLGGAFGILVLSNLSSERTANQIFPFVIFPQFFLAGVFAPIKELPLPLLILSRAVPMTYAVDLVRSVYYRGLPEFEHVVLFNTPIDLAVVAVMFAIFLVLGTFLFIRNETNR